MTNLIEALFKSWEDKLAQCEQQIKLMEFQMCWNP